jgi:hypothetical protein
MPRILFVDAVSPSQKIWYGEILKVATGGRVYSTQVGTLRSARDAFKEYRNDLLAIVVDALVPVDTESPFPTIPSTPEFIQWVREMGYQGPIVAATEAWGYDEVLENAGCDYTCDKFQVIDYLGFLLNFRRLRRTAPPPDGSEIDRALEVFNVRQRTADEAAAQLQADIDRQTGEVTELLESDEGRKILDLLRQLGEEIEICPDPMGWGRCSFYLTYAGFVSSGYSFGTSNPLRGAKGVDRVTDVFVRRNPSQNLKAHICQQAEKLAQQVR